MLSLPSLHPPAVPHTHLHFPGAGQPPRHHNGQNHNNQQSHQPQTCPILARLRADERHIAHRKHLIRRLGANHIRPPGISKTLQGMAEEQAEKQEAEEVRRREDALFEAQVAAEEQEGDIDAEMGGMGEAARVLGTGVMGGPPLEGEEEGEEEADLDDEVPEGSLGWESSEDDEGVGVGRDENGIEGMDGDGDGITGGSFLGGQAEGEGDYDVPGMLEGDGGGVPGAGGLGRLPGTGGLGPATPGAIRNLDDDVPEAGSYQHTDTEAEDDSFEEGRNSFVMGGSGRGVFGSPPPPVAIAGGYDGAGGRRSSGRVSGGGMISEAGAQGNGGRIGGERRTSGRR